VQGLDPDSQYWEFNGTHLKPHVIARIQAALKQRRAAAKRRRSAVAS